jgi:uncharacterized protein with NAD-binding domain and iron-sulfur cluster
MRGGMGETVFSPLYRVLKARGVQFNFLHSLKEVKFDGDRHETRIVELTLTASRPARDSIADGPLDHFGCWRHKPPKIKDTRTVRLKDVKDFDAVILSMAIDDFRVICGKQLAKQNERWKRMLESSKTVATQAAQVWMTKDLEELGWRRGSVLVSALEGPLETWADMTHTFGAEHAWRAHPNSPVKHYGHDVKSVAYFCGLLPQREINPKEEIQTARDLKETTDRLRDTVERNLRDLLKSRMKAFWPAAGSTIPEPLLLLATPTGHRGGTLADQHVQANFSGSDRYTLAVPGSLEHRISPLSRLVNNMTIAGDWTECGFNEGCIEAAVMSGMLAAHAISGRPKLNDIIGYNHP